LLAAFLLFVAVSVRATPIEVRYSAPSGEPVSGRLIIFARRIDGGDAAASSIDGSPFAPDRVAATARDVASLAPGQTVQLGSESAANATPVRRNVSNRFMISPLSRRCSAPLKARKLTHVRIPRKENRHGADTIAGG